MAAPICAVASGERLDPHDAAAAHLKHIIRSGILRSEPHAADR